MKPSALWTALLGAPLIWLVYLQIAYMLAPAACNTGDKTSLAVITAAALAAILAAALLGRRAWNRAGAGYATEENDASGRSRFIALMGMGAAALFGLVIVAGGIFIFVLGACD